MVLKKSISGEARHMHNTTVYWISDAFKERVVQSDIPKDSADEEIPF